MRTQGSGKQIIGRIFDVRWVSSSERTLKAVWASYAALHEHFLAASTDPQRGIYQLAKSTLA